MTGKPIKTVANIHFQTPVRAQPHIYVGAVTIVQLMQQRPP